MSRELPQKHSLYRNLLMIISRGVFVFIFLLLGYLFYGTAITRVFTQTGAIVSFILIWAVTAYFFLPRTHRFLARLYLPSYYIGRASSKDGLLADPINIAINSDEQSLIEAMELAGWHQAEPVTPRNVLRIIKASALKHSYRQAPVSPLLLFEREQDLAFQKEVNGNPRARHHVRFWRTPSGWFLPGGYTADWIGAATYDRRVGISLFTGQITHKIEAETDQERDHLIETLSKTPHYSKLHVVKNFTTAYHHRNSGGDSIRTDGSMPFLTLERRAESA